MSQLLILENSLKVKNYKCFVEKEQGFEKICPLNIIIGKNNSGKSSLIDLVEYAIKRNSDFIETRETGITQVLFGFSLSLDYYKNICKQITANKENLDRYLDRFYDNNKHSIFDKDYSFNLEGNFRYNEYFENNGLGGTSQDFKSFISNIFNKKIFLRINAERDIKVSGNVDSIEIGFNGDGATNLLRIITHNTRFKDKNLDPDIVKTKLFNALKSITSSDIFFDEVSIRNVEGKGIWEIWFKDIKHGLIPLSKMGSGIKTILLVLINLIAVPYINNYREEDIYFCFEELENNLHPSLQKRLFNFIANYVKEHKCHVFITTHSSLVIDLFANDPYAQLLHVQNNNGVATVNTIETNKDGHNVLKDLGYKPSDVLLSNGVIWVEGPSDAIYLEMLLNLYQKQPDTIQLSNLNFTIQVLATAIWKYAGFEKVDWSELKNDSERQNQIITLTKLNHNHLIVIDNDGNYQDRKPSEWDCFVDGNGKNKAKLIYESINFSNQIEDNLSSNFGNTKDDKLMFWVNDGTFETYLEHFVKNKGKDDFAKYFDTNNKENSYFEKKRKGQKDNSISKVELAIQIEKFSRTLTFQDFATIECKLNNKIERLVNTIKLWNE